MPIEKIEGILATAMSRLLITVKLIQSLGKLIYTNRWEIRKNMLSSLSFLTYRD